MVRFAQEPPSDYLVAYSPAGDSRARWLTMPTGSDSSDAENVPPSALSDRISASLERADLTLGDLTDLLDEGSFALVLLVLMVPSALPVPTGGVTHLLELGALVVTAQYTFGREDLWLPKRVARHELGATFKEKAVPKLVAVVRWFERFTRRRFAGLLESTPARMLIGFALIVFVLGAFLAPPFSGLDTLPSLGVVVAAIGLLVGDGIVVALGLGIGVAGVALVVALGSVAWSLFA